jgi:hypothetical protein
MAVEKGQFGGNSLQEDTTMITTTYGPFSFDRHSSIGFRVAAIPHE